ncbi:MAG: hypothetical protein KC549_11970, partial [Myxococcales bacterium]|nr:hypothetical protein [Myxococcales bacterium]
LAERGRGYGEGVAFERPDLAVVSDDGATAVVWTDAQHVALYDVASQRLTPLGDVGAYERGGGVSLAMSADGRFVAATAVTGQTYNDDGLLVVWDRAGGPPVAAVPLPDVAPYAVALSPDGALAAVARQNPPGNPGLWPEGIDVIDVASGGLLFRILALDEPNPPGLACRGHINRGLAFSPLGDRLAAGGQQINGASCTPTAVVEIWNLATREKEQTLTGPPRLGVDFLRYSPDGTTLAVASRLVQAPSPLTFDLTLWDAASGALVQQLESGSVPAITGANGLAYSPDGQRLVTWGAGNGDDDFAVGQVSTYGVAP